MTYSLFPCGKCDLLDILNSDHLSIVLYILDHVEIRNLSEPIEIFTDSDRFQSLAPELISPRIETNSGVDADKASRNFRASCLGI
jgi:hypothetical protein